jgi:hypothetical protein
VFGGLVAQPKLGALDGEASDHAVTRIHAKLLGRTEGRLVEVHGAGTIANGEPGGDGGVDVGMVGHKKLLVKNDAD